MSGLVTTLLCSYFSLNLVCALALHIHASRQAHLRLRPLDVVVHFALLTLFAIPALIAVTLSAFFGRGRETLSQPAPVSAAAARAA